GECDCEKLGQRNEVAQVLADGGSHWPYSFLNFSGTFALSPYCFTAAASIGTFKNLSGFSPPMADMFALNLATRSPPASPFLPSTDRKRFRSTCAAAARALSA